MKNQAKGEYRRKRMHDTLGQKIPFDTSMENPTLRCQGSVAPPKEPHRAQQSLLEGSWRWNSKPGGDKTGGGCSMR